MALIHHTDAQLATRFVDLVGDLVWPLNLSLGVALLFLFPDGRSLSPRWRLAVQALFLDLALLTVAQAVNPGPLESHNRVWNPLGVPRLGAIAAFTLNAGQSLLIVFIPLAILSLVLRYRRAPDAGRQQIKWFMYGSAVMIILIVAGAQVASAISSDPNDPIGSMVGNTSFALGILALPVGVGVGAIRYRLYDIDALINRTLVYGLLTALLGALYFGLIVGAQTLIRLFTGQQSQSPVVIVLSTLLIAALVQPLRRRLQTTIDRRFYRRKYDAARTLASLWRDAAK